MKNILPALLFCASLARADMLVVQEFFSTNPAIGASSQEMTIVVSGGKLRIDHSQGGMIVLPAEKKSIMLMHPQKSYMVMPDSSQMPGGAQMQGGAPSQSGVTTSNEPDPMADLNWEKTGKKEQIAGYEAEQWIGKDKTTGKMLVEVWTGGSASLAKEYYDSLSGTGGGMMSQLADKLKSIKDTGPYAQGYPLKSITYDENGAVTATTTVKKLETSPADAKWFAVPDGYKEFQMPAFGSGAADVPPGMPSE